MVEPFLTAGLVVSTQELRNLGYPESMVVSSMLVRHSNFASNAVGIMDGEDAD